MLKQLLCFSSCCTLAAVGPFEERIDDYISFLCSSIYRLFRVTLIILLPLLQLSALIKAAYRIATDECLYVYKLTEVGVTTAPSQVLKKSSEVASFCPTFSRFALIFQYLFSNLTRQAYRTTYNKQGSCVSIKGTVSR